MIDRHTDNGRPVARGALSRRGFLGRAASLGVAATASAGPFGGALADAPDGDGKLFLIALEEHFATPELRRRQTGRDEQLFAGGGRRPELLDLGAGRIADMDEAGIAIQVLSAVTPGAQTLPGAEGVAFACKLNDRIAQEVVAAYPERFRAFATLPLSDPQAAADELERAVREHGFVGCMSYGRLGAGSWTTPTSRRCSPAPNPFACPSTSTRTGLRPRPWRSTTTDWAILSSARSSAARVMAGTRRSLSNTCA